VLLSLLTIGKNLDNGINSVRVFMTGVEVRSKIAQKRKHDKHTQAQYETRHRDQGIDFLSLDIPQSDFDVAFDHVSSLLQSSHI
jgi:hypothetical protein